MVVLFFFHFTVLVCVLCVCVCVCLAEAMEEQLKREIAISKKMRHPNVVMMREVFKTRNHINIVLEFVTGGELFDRIGESIWILCVLFHISELSSFLCGVVTLLWSLLLFDSVISVVWLCSFGSCIACRCGMS